MYPGRQAGRQADRYLVFCIRFVHRLKSAVVDLERNRSQPEETTPKGFDQMSTGPTGPFKP